MEPETTQSNIIPTYPIRYSKSTWNRKPSRKNGESARVAIEMRSSKTSTQAMVSLEELEKILIDGRHVVALGDYRDGKESLANRWTSGQLIALDYEPIQQDDYTDEVLVDCYSIDEMLDHAKKYFTPPDLIYFTFSHTEFASRYRPIWTLSETVTDKDAMKMCIAAIHAIFEDTGIDKGAKDVGRLWNPGNECDDYSWIKIKESRLRSNNGPFNPFEGGEIRGLTLDDYKNTPSLCIDRSSGPNPVLSIGRILSCLEAFYHETKGNHAAEHIQRFADRHNIRTVDTGRLQFLITSTAPESGRFISSSLHGEQAFIPSLLDAPTYEQGDNKSFTMKDAITTAQDAALSSACEKYRRFKARIKLSNSDAFCLVSALQDRSGFEKAWRQQYKSCSVMNQIISKRKSGGYGESCSIESCSFYGKECKAPPSSIRSIIGGSRTRQTVITLEQPEKPIRPSADIYQDYSAWLQDRVSNWEQYQGRIALGMVETGIGKTYAIENLQSLKRCGVFFTTHEMKEEAGRDRIGRNHPVSIWKDIPSLNPAITATLKELQASQYPDINRYLYDTALKCDDYMVSVDILTYLRYKTFFYTTKNPIIATHHKAYTMKSGIKQFMDTAILDEDILNTCLQQLCITRSNIERMYGLTSDTIVKEYLDRILSIQCPQHATTGKGIIYKGGHFANIWKDSHNGRLNKAWLKAFTPDQYIPKNTQELPAVISLLDYNLCCNHIDRGQDSYIFARNVFHLHPAVSYIVTTATANIELYKLLFKDALDIQDMRGQIKPEGVFNQYLTNTSRTEYLKDSTAIEANVNHALSKGCEYSITTKADLESVSALGLIKGTTIGRESGLDGLRGKNIAILNTPAKPLICSVVDYHLCSGQLDAIIEPLDVRPRRAKSSHHSFLYPVPSNEAYASVHVSNIVNAQLQSSGRSRFYTNPSGQSHLYSDVPTPGSTLHYITAQDAQEGACIALDSTIEYTDTLIHEDDDNSTETKIDYFMNALKESPFSLIEPEDGRYPDDEPLPDGYLKERYQEYWKRTGVTGYWRLDREPEEELLVRNNWNHIKHYEYMRAESWKLLETMSFETFIAESTNLEWWTRLTETHYDRIMETEADSTVDLIENVFIDDSVTSEDEDMEELFNSLKADPDIIILDDTDDDYDYTEGDDDMVDLEADYAEPEYDYEMPLMANLEDGDDEDEEAIRMRQDKQREEEYEQECKDERAANEARARTMGAGPAGASDEGTGKSIQQTADDYWW